MNRSIRILLLAAASGIALSSTPAMASTFTNGGFETGDFTGWTTGTGFRGGENNSLINPSQFVPGGSLNDPTLMHSQVVGSSYVDPNVGSLLGSTVLLGKYSARIEDTVNGGYASVAQQQVTNYTDKSIFFAYKAVLEGAHGPDEAATMQVLLTDTTTGKVLVNQMYNAASSGTGVGSQFSFDPTSGAYYTPKWQTVQLSTPNLGDSYLLQILGSDCQPTGHYGYVYLDGIGGTSPVPLPATLPMFAAAIVALGVGAGYGRSRSTRANHAAG